MPDHTPDERRAINDAWDAIHYVTERTDWHMPTMWRTALKHERKGRSTATDAKALMARCFLEGATAAVDAAELYTLAEGCRTAHIIGARVASHYPQLLAEVLFDKCKAAAEAQDKALKRALDGAAGLGATP